jgi:O-methyltransferase
MSCEEQRKHSGAGLLGEAQNHSSQLSLTPSLNTKRQSRRRIRDRVKDSCPRSVLMAQRFLRQSEWKLIGHFWADKNVRLPLKERIQLTARCYRATHQIECHHSESEIVPVIRAALSVPESISGVIVEAGCYRGGSTVKLSLAAAAAGRTLVVFDSFDGIPVNNEISSWNIHGGTNITFGAGDYRGTLEEVKRNIGGYGRLDACQFEKGWFEDTMPKFTQPVITAYIDVDLASSTRTCLRFLYPLLVPGGSIFSQDGHLSLVIALLRDERFWHDEVGCFIPRMEGLGTKKLVRITKPRSE